MTTQAKHTPGPWKAELVVTHTELGHFAPPAHYQIQAEQSPIGATLVCELRPYGKDNDANARLIASAPALLEALQDMLDAYAPNAQHSVNNSPAGENVLHPAVKAARAAIQSATLNQ